MATVRTALRRYGGLLFLVGGACVIVSSSTGMGIGPLYLTGVVLCLLWTGVRVLGQREQRPPRFSRGEAGEAGRAGVLVGLPMAGPWSALNGPAEKVPSHGTHTLGQTYAMDVLYQPSELPAELRRPSHLVWPVVRRPQAYPSFGRPILAPASGEIVAVRDGKRDHLTRMSLPGVLYLYLEGAVRSALPPSALLGNHVVLRLDAADASGDPVYALLAHLRRGSSRVAVGDRVAEGQQLGECGNSGNSSDPHLHFQLMDGPDALTARGVPFRWAYVDADGEHHVGVPANGTTFSPASEGGAHAPFGDHGSTYDTYESTGGAPEAATGGTSTTR